MWPPPPAIGSDGTVYVGTLDKKLYAIKTDSKGPWPMCGQNARHTGRAITVNPPSQARLEHNSTSQGTFTILAHNVENLFDLDGVSAYNDYKPEYYGASQLQRKLANLTNLLARFGDGSGPDVVLLQEIELDRTAERDKSAAELLAEALREKGSGSLPPRGRPNKGTVAEGISLYRLRHVVEVPRGGSPDAPTGTSPADT